MEALRREKDAPETRKPCKETVVLALVCGLDLVTTVVLVLLGLAEEANPLMAYFLERGIVVFCVAKLLFVIPPLMVAEYYRRYNEALVRGTLRAVTIAYLAIYVLGFFTINAPPSW